MALSAAQLAQISSAAAALPLNAPPIRYETFVSQELGLSANTTAQMLPDPDPTGIKAIAIAKLTKSREDILTTECRIPSFVVETDPQGRTSLSGLLTYLSAKNPPDQKLIGRIAHHDSIRQALLSIRQGHHLEAVSAAILNTLCDYGEATSGSSDQGIDSIGWNRLVLLDPVFAGDGIPVGEKVFFFASSKSVTRGVPKLLNPAFIRELVGGWIIQRTKSGVWQNHGVQTLSPLQMIFATTYRLSTDARSLCKELGIQVWSIPELIYLIAKAAPDSVFDPQNNHLFSPANFRSWWMPRHTNRVRV